MSIPERLWRLARGYVAEAGERLAHLDRLQAEADAYGELADALRHPAPPAAPLDVRDRPSVEPSTTGAQPTPPPRLVSLGGGRDPLETSYAVLRVEPGVQLAEVDQAYQARLAELAPERFGAGSVERAHVEAQQRAVSAAYERLRDALNPTETRFEHIEF